MITAQILDITEETLFDDMLQIATERGMYLVTNGQKTVISPIVPPGFVKIVVKVHTPNTATLETMPCAA